MGTKLTSTFLFLCCSFAFCVLADDPQQKPSSQNRPDSLQANEDTTQAHFHNEGWLNQLKGEALLRLWVWDNPDQFSYPAEIYLSKLAVAQSLPDISVMVSIGNPYANPEYDFRDDPAYRLAYAQEIVAPEYGKSNNVIMVSPLTVAYLAYLGFREYGWKHLRSKKDPYENITLKETEIEMARILWENPDMSATEWYKTYYRMNDAQDMTFLAFQRQVDNLLRKKLIRSRRVLSEGARYSPAISPALLKRKLKAQQQSRDALSDSTRYRELLQMNKLLEKN